MAQCVRVIPAGTDIGDPGGPGKAYLTVPVLGVDSSCASGLQVLTAAEIQANKSTLKMDVESDPARRQDMFDLFYAFLFILISVWAIKRLLDLFSGEGDK